MESKMEKDPVRSAMLPVIVPGKNRTQLAREVLDYCFRVMPDKATKYDVYTTQFIPLLQQVGNRKLADDIATVMHKRAVEDLDYMIKNRMFSNMFDIQSNMVILQQLVNAYRGVDKTRAEKYRNDLETLQSSIPVDFNSMDAGEYEEE